MSVKTDAGKRTGFLARLRKDESGNVIAIMAAAVFPAIGIIGGGVDMSRLYLTRTSLQAACDAGALMGRRTMGNSTWAANDGRANTRALQLFDTNFENGAYGSINRERSFSESGGTVTGEASASVPMALMSVFGIENQNVSVTCSAEMRIPASDIMFVLDTTGSMNCPDDGSSCPNGNNNNVEASNSKMRGLRTAAGCFYEALAKQNIDSEEVEAEDCGEEEDPVGATSDVRLRFGFVPYAVNVNVGKLLPQAYMSNTWTYQSREAAWEPRTDPNAYDASYGPEGSFVETGRNTTTTPDGNWANRTQNYIDPNGQTWSYYSEQQNTPLTCASNVPSTTVPNNGTRAYSHQNPTTVSYPTSTVTRYYNTTNSTYTHEYRYQSGSYTTGNGNKKKTWHTCQLQRRTVGQSSTQIGESTTTTVTWVYAPLFLHWTYKPTAFNVSGLKNSDGTNWNSSVALPIADSGANRFVTWNGCIEERQTARVTDNDPSNNWNPIPSTALDMDIESAPDAANPATLWGPLLGGAIYTRDRRTSGNWNPTINTFQTSSNEINSSVATHTYGGNIYDPDQLSFEYCPSQAQLYEVETAETFWDYMAGLQTGGNTYHDIGLLWGARLMAPDGIFSATTSDTDTWVERHMIFMTDGDTSIDNLNYSSYGVHWWDRRQNSGTAAPSNDWLESNVDARTQAICKWVRDENITLWVIAFGRGISAATKTNLENCATPGRYFAANDTATLITKFKSIANQISALRLTQ